MHCIHCDKEVHPKRVDILIKNNLPITCLEHSQTEKVVGFQVNHDKACRQIEVMDSTQYKRLRSLERKTGGATGGPGLGGKIVYKK